MPVNPNVLSVAFPDDSGFFATEERDGDYTSGGIAQLTRSAFQAECRESNPLQTDSLVFRRMMLNKIVAVGVAERRAGDVTYDVFEIL